MDGLELRRQIDKLLCMAEAKRRSIPLLTAETKLWRGMYSKDYYEPADDEVVSMISQKARSVLSIGCGWGESECKLVEKGLQVVAVPLDPVICGRAAARGVEMVVGDVRYSQIKTCSGKI